MLNEHTSRVNLMWDILNGCPYTCAGCHIDKKLSKVPNKDTLDDIKNLLSSMSDYGYDPDIVTLGPVDAAQAVNTYEVLTGKDTSKIISCFQRIAMPSRMLNRDRKLTELLNSKYPDLEIEFQMVIDLPQFHKDHYLEVMAANMEWYRQNLKHKTIKFYPVFNLFDYINSKCGPLVDYAAIDARCYKFFNFGVDYAFSFSRLDTLPKNDVFRLFKSLKTMFDNHVTEANTGNIHFATGHAGDSSMITLAQFHNKLFLVPVVYEHYVTYKDAFKVASWSFSGVQATLNKLHASAVASKAMTEGECASCEYMGVCLSRMAISWMDEHDITTCIMPKNAYSAMN